MQASQVAGGVVLNQSGQVLVVNQYGSSWSLPKGHVEAGEDLLTAATREIYEESGVKELEYISDLGSYERMGGKGMKELKHITIFLFKTLEIKLAPRDPHNPEARWVPRDEVVDLLTYIEDKEFWLRVKDDLKNLGL